MPSLKPRHEKFCQFVVAGDSYLAAYMKAREQTKKPASEHSARQMASMWAMREDVQARISELRDDIKQVRLEVVAEEARQDLIAREWVIEQLKDNVKRAKSGKRMDGATANKALELLGKEIGMFVERSVSENITHVISDEPLTNEEWAEQYAETTH